MATATSTATTSTNDNCRLMSIKYNLIPINSYQALLHIRDLTADVSNISPEFMNSLYNKMIDRFNIERPTVFSYLPAPASSEVSKKVIGGGGYYFKLTTTNCGVDFIWHDRMNNSFLFWGPSNFRLIRALNIIRSRILKYEALQALEACQGQEGWGQGQEGWGQGQAQGQAQGLCTNEIDDFDYSDMPDLIDVD